MKLVKSFHTHRVYHLSFCLVLVGTSIFFFTENLFSFKHFSEKYRLIVTCFECKLIINYSVRKIWWRKSVNLFPLHGKIGKSNQLYGTSVCYIHQAAIFDLPFFFHHLFHITGKFEVNFLIFFVYVCKSGNLNETNKSKRTKTKIKTFKKFRSSICCILYNVYSILMSWIEVGVCLHFTLLHNTNFYIACEL